MKRMVSLWMSMLLTFCLMGQVSYFTPANEPGSNEYAPAISFDGNTLIFESDRTGDWRLYEVKRQSGNNWSPPRALHEINKYIPAGKFVGASFQSYDGKYLLFTTDAPQGQGDMDLWIAEKDGFGWSSPEPLPVPVNSAAYEGFPSISEDGNTLFFLRKNLPGQPDSKTNFYLYFSQKNTRNEWDEPFYVPGLEIFTSIETPKILADGKTLVFSAHTPESQSGLDLYKARVTSDFHLVEILKMDSMNSVWNDLAYSSDGSGNRWFFARTIDNQDDIFMYEIRLEGIQKSGIQLNINLIDAISRLPVAGTLHIRDKVSQQTLLNDQQAAIGFKLLLAEKSNIELLAASPGHLDQKVDIYLSMGDQLVNEILSRNPTVKDLSRKIILPKKEGELLEKAIEQESYAREILLQEYAINQEIIAIKTTGLKGKSKAEREKIKKKLEKMKVDSGKMHEEACQLRSESAGAMYLILQQELIKYTGEGEMELVKAAEEALFASKSFRNEAAGYRKKLNKTSVKKNILSLENLAYEAEQKALRQLLFAYEFNLQNLYFNRTEVLQEIALTPLKKDFSMILNTILFDFDRSSIRDESLDQLNFLVNLMHENPELRIEISAHTDDKGSVSYNEKLSLQRATSVVNYLIDKNIDSNRLTPKGYGSSKPLVPNDSDFNRAKNRRVEFKVLESADN